MATDYVTTVIQWGVARDAARRYYNDDLKDQALQATRDRLTKGVNAHLASVAATARTRAGSAEASVAAAQQAVTRIGTVAERESGWKRAQMLLDSGRTLDRVIASATDPLMLAGIAEWGPTWLLAQQPANDDPTRPEHYGLADVDTSWVVPAVAQRLADISGTDPVFARAVSAAAQARVDGVWADVLDDLATAGRVTGSHATALHRIDDGQSYAAVSGVLFGTQDPNPDTSPLGWSQVAKLMPAGVS